MMKRIIYFWFVFAFLLTPAWAKQSFIVNDIQIRGLQSISQATVENYLPIKRGQTLKTQTTPKILRSLYNTGFFDDITLSREKNTLVINVVERPVIGQLSVSGNSTIPTDKLTKVMRSLDIIEGRIYNPAILERIKQSLLNQYYQLGYYNARVSVYVTPLPRNRVTVKVDISEGLPARIQNITIIGNRVFDQKTLLNQLDLSTSNLVTFFTKADRYSEERLDNSLEKLKSYYMDHGYIRMEIKSSQAQVTPDRKNVDIIIVVVENEPYTVDKFQITGKLIGPPEEYYKIAQIKPGEIFSRQKLMDAQKAVNKYLGDQGYLFTNISIHPKINDEAHTISIVMEVKPGNRTYIRNITFSDNMRTNDVVLRREVLQMEAAPVSATSMDLSKRNLSSLPYIENVNMTVNPVSEDLVDINYQVKEASASQASAKFGYSTQNGGLMFGAGINQKNFLGTGNTLGLNFTLSKVQQYYAIDYMNPYYTADGISRSFNLSVSRVDPGKSQDVNSAYTMNEVNAGVLYSIPIGPENDVFNRIIFGAAYQNFSIRTVKKADISAQVAEFVDKHGKCFNEIDFKLGYTRDSRDRAIFPTRGSVNSLFLDIYAPVGSHSLSFYTMSYHGKWYVPLINDFIFISRAELGYGNNFSGNGLDFPFFKNYFAGGIDTVRGYLAYNLGPRDSNGDAYGGNIVVDGSVGVILPNFISDNVRTSLFVDAGNVYTTYNNRKFGGESTNAGPIRFTVGVEFDIITPIAPLSLAIAVPIDKGPFETEIPNFALTANF